MVCTNGQNFSPAIHVTKPLSRIRCHAARGPAPELEGDSDSDRIGQDRTEQDRTGHDRSVLECGLGEVR